MESEMEVEERTGEAADRKVYIAVGKEWKENSSNLGWCLQRFKGRTEQFVILHVHRPSEFVRSPMGGKMHPSQLDPREVTRYRREESEKMNKCIAHYREHCEVNQVTADIAILEWDDVKKGIVESIFQHNIRTLVMGAAANSKYARSMSMPTSKKALHVKSHAPQWCQVLFVCNGNLVYPSGRSQSTGDQSARRSLLSPSSWFGRRSGGSRSLPSSSQGNMPYLQSTSSSCSASTDSHCGHFLFSDDVSTVGPTSESSSVWQLEAGDEEDHQEEEEAEEEEERGEDTTTSGHRNEGRVDATSQEEELELRELLRKYKLEAKTLRKDAYDELVKRQKAEDDAEDARRKASLAEGSKRESEEKMRQMENLLKQMNGRIAELESDNAWLRSKIAEQSSDLEAKDKLLEEQSGVIAESQRDRARKDNFIEFSFSELNDATHGFHSSLQIGGGGFGEVYKAEIHHTAVAIKKLNSQGAQGTAEFQQELLALTKLRHPHLVTLIGACSEARCLVYEHLSNGSLADHLFANPATINEEEDRRIILWWKQRLRIAAEVCLALLFLHCNAVVHSDMKPANILLDANLKAKISDFGICRFLAKPQRESTETVCRLTDPKGTGMYMDPQFMMTGELTFKSDVYAFGVIVLQLLTGKSAFGLIKEVEDAVKSQTIHKIVDRDAGKWPSGEVIQMAEMGLRCCELERKFRPDLEQVWKLLQRYISEA